MKIRLITTSALLALPLMGVHAQTASQDMKNAGSHTKAAAQDAGSGISKGSKKAYHSSKRSTKKAYNKTKAKVDGNPNTK